MTTSDLENLISQTEYDVAVTPVYDVGMGSPMIGQAITGKGKWQPGLPAWACPLSHVTYALVLGGTLGGNIHSGPVIWASGQNQGMNVRKGSACFQSHCP